jgi:thiosulfate reductase cytochrome b subunit
MQVALDMKSFAERGRLRSHTIWHCYLTSVALKQHLAAHQFKKGLCMISQAHQPLGWILLAALLAYLMYLSFSAYLSPDFLIGYANMFSC